MPRAPVTSAELYELRETLIRELALRIQGHSSTKYMRDAEAETIARNAVVVTLTPRFPALARVSFADPEAHS